jgi:hypothetical protein
VYFGFFITAFNALDYTEWGYVMIGKEEGMWRKTKLNILRLL